MSSGSGGDAGPPDASVANATPALLRIRTREDRHWRDVGLAADLVHQVLPGGRRDDESASRVRQAIADLAFRRVVADGNDDRAGAQRGEACFDPVHAVRQIDRDPVAVPQTGLRQVGRDRSGPPGEVARR